jgi:hypothetical protein
MISNKYWKKMANKSMHRTAIPLRSIAAGELGRYTIESVMEENDVWIEYFSY